MQMKMNTIFFTYQINKKNTSSLKAISLSTNGKQFSNIYKEPEITIRKLGKDSCPKMFKAIFRTFPLEV